MFGYVRYDYPNLFVKDVMLYQSAYCGLCKGIARASGQAARLGLSYDMAFLSVLLHNIMGVDFRIEKQNCFEHAVKKRPIAAVDPLTEELGALNTVLCYYKLTDDIEDAGKGGGKRLWFRAGFKRAKKKYPSLVSLVETYMAEQRRAEREKIASPEMAAEPSACMLQSLSEHFLADMGTSDTLGLFHELGKWIYLVDALDDYDKDLEKGNYNPFALAYGAPSKEALIAAAGADIAFLFDTTFYAMREHLAGVTFHFNRDLTDNVILRGIPLETQRVMRGEPRVRMSVKV